jgi:hypothetical protein
VVAQGVGGAVAGALLVVATDLAAGGVHVHHQRPVAGAGTRRPRPAKDRLSDRSYAVTERRAE